MNRLAELLAILSDEAQRALLTDAELGALDAEVAQLFAGIRAGEVEDIDANDTDRLREVGHCRIALAIEAGERFAAAEGVAADVAAIAAEAGFEAAEGAAAAAEGDEAEGGDEGDAAGAEGAEGDVGAEGAEGDAAEGDEAGAEGEGIQAGAGGGRALPTLGDLRGRTPRARRTVPVVQVHEGSAGDITWLPTSEVISAHEFAERLSRYGDDHTTAMPIGQKVRLGRRATLSDNAISISADDSPETFMRKLEQATEGMLSPASWDNGHLREGIQASGGWGAPTPQDYSVDTIAVADRPVRAALQSVNVPRGSLSLIKPPLFTDIVTGGPTNTGAAVGIWTNANDQAASTGSPVKSHQRAPVAQTFTVTLDALYMSLELGVLQSRAFPEWIAAFQQNTEAAYARMAETYLLDKIEAAYLTKHVSQASVVGAARDYFSFMVSLASQERNRQRMRPDAMLRALYPAWLIDMVAMDILRDGSITGNPQVVARTYLEQQLRAANINASWYMDSSTLGGQLMSAQPNEDDINEFPSNVRSYLFPEGTFVVGDNGTFDAGIIRDSDLVETNDFRIFNESFETLIPRGHWAYTFDTNLCPSGSSSAPVDIQHLCTTGS